MGRTLKRVPLDFDWPTNEVWHGYIDQPDLPPCPDCKDTNGYTPEAYAIDQTFYPHQIGWGNDPRANVLAWGDKIGQKEVDNLVAEGRLWDFTRHVEAGKGWVDNDPPTHPTADEVNAWQRGRGMGHDGVNRWVLVKFRCQQLGIPVTCRTCDGSMNVGSPEEKAVAEAWQPTEPPEGPGYQMWETTSEGSPQSPVFATLRELAEWCAKNATTFGSVRANADDWERMLDDDMVAYQTTMPDGSKAIFL